MILTIRAFLLFEIALFGVAALTHFGVLLQGYRHQQAGTAETVIGVVLLAGLALTWIGPRWARLGGIGTQAFALLGVMVGVFTIAIGVGPRTALDLVVHGAMLALLITGLAMALRKAAA